MMNPNQRPLKTIMMVDHLSLRESPMEAQKPMMDLAQKTESDFMSLRPATTNVFVFVANPDRNTVHTNQGS